MTRNDTAYREIGLGHAPIDLDGRAVCRAPQVDEMRCIVGVVVRDSEAREGLRTEAVELFASGHRSMGPEGDEHLDARLGHPGPRQAREHRRQHLAQRRRARQIVDNDHHPLHARGIGSITTPGDYSNGT